MKKKFKLLALLMSLMLVVTLLPGCGSEEGLTYPDDFPDEILYLMDVSEKVVTECAKKLDGEWGDKHAAMMEPILKGAEGMDAEEFAEYLADMSEDVMYSDAYQEMWEVLDGLLDDIMAERLDELTDENGKKLWPLLYALYPLDLDDIEGDFFFTVDASPSGASDFGDFEEDGTELGMISSWYLGLPKPVTYAYEYKGIYWVAFAPIHNSKGEIVAVLGLDYPCPIVADMPEWNFDSDEWNGFEWD